VLTHPEPSTSHHEPAPARPWLIRMVVARIALLLLAVAALYQGVWAQVAPRSFYDDFPGGMGWIAGEGPYNEHLTRDVGGLVTGLGVVAIVAAWSLATPLLVATALGWLVYGVPHLVFHSIHALDDGSMQVVNIVVLSSEILLPILGLLAVGWHEARSHPQPVRGHLTAPSAS
jgi:hypothetical protein